MLETQVASGHPILERLPRTDSRATLEIAVVLRCVLFVALSAARVLQAASWSCVPGSFRAKVPGGNLMRRRYGVTTKLEQKGQLYAIAAPRRETQDINNKLTQAQGHNPPSHERASSAPATTDLL